MFGQELKRWRGARRMSQEALGDVAGVSPRHLSCLERGIAWPSELMVMKLSRALDLPLRERNAFLSTAGFAQRYRDSGETIPPTLRKAVDRLLSAQNCPAYVLSGRYRVLDANPMGWTMLKLLTPNADVGMDLGKVFLGNGPHRDLIVNYREAAQGLLARLRADAAMQGPHSPLLPIITGADRDPSITASNDDEDHAATVDPVLPLTVRLVDVTTKWMTALLTFGGAQDAMVEQLTIEQLLPADDAAEAFVEQLSAG